MDTLDITAKDIDAQASCATHYQNAHVAHNGTVLQQESQIRIFSSKCVQCSSACYALSNT